MYIFDLNNDKYMYIFIKIKIIIFNLIMKEFEDYKTNLLKCTTM